MKRFGVQILMAIKLLFVSHNLFALETLSYSGRLVQTNGSPVAGPVTLRAELAYTNALATVLCTEDIPSVTLTKGVFHIKLNLDCSASGLTLTQVLSQVPNGESVAIRITDITNIITPISYNFQALHAIPFANVASQLVQMGATNDQVLKWNNTTKKWEPGSPGGGGTVTTVSGTLPISVANGTSTPVVSISQANSTTNGYLSSTDWNTFNNKQNALPGGGNTTHYLRGDSSWQTLNTDAVTEGTKLYFENARVLLAPLTGFLPASSAIVDTDTVLSAFNKTQGQINTINSNATHFLLKDSADTLSSNVTLSGSISSTLTGDIIVRDTPLGLTSAVNKGYVDSGDALKVNKSGDTISGVLTLDDDLKIKATGAGTNYVTIRANSAAGNYNLVLPTTAGTTGQFLQTDGSGNLSWVAQSSSATPSGAAGGDLAGTYPNPTLKTGVVTDTHIATTLSQSKITNLTTDLANKQSTTLASGNILVGNGSNVATAVAVSGDATLNNTGVLTLSNSGVTAGTYNSVTVDGKGRVTGGTLGTTISSLGVTAPITNTGTVSDPVIAINQANTTTNGYLSSTDWNTFNNKQATISKTTTQDVSKLRIYGANATNYVELSAATLTGNRSLIFPDSNGSSGNVLSTDGAGNLSWTSLSTAAPVTSVNTLTGAVTLTTTNIAEGTNQYHTGERVLATPITAPTLTNAAITTSDTVQVAFGKLQAQFNNILSLALSGLSTATNAAITASDTIISAFGKLQKQITDLTGDVTTLSASNSNKLNKNTADSITATITVNGAGDILVPSTPAGMTSAVNKTYVDDRIANASNQWGTDGTNVYRSSGNVGIGTTTPRYKLDFGGSNNIQMGFDSLNSSPNAGIFRFGDNTGWKLHFGRAYESSTGGSPAANSGTTGSLLTIVDTGNIGIGTTAPTNLVSLGGNAARTMWMERHTTANTAGNNLTLQAGGATSAATDKNGGGLILSGGTATGTGTSTIYFQTATAQGSTNTTDNAPTTKMTILGNGNVGIGTNAPAANLHVYNSDTNIAEIYATGNAQGSGVLFVGQSPTFGAGILYNGDDNPDQLGASDDVVFFRRDAGVDYEVFKYRYNSNNVTFTGNIGIGTTAPTNLVSLGGNAARTMWMERHTTANTAGNNLTLQAGGATSAATDKNGGGLILSGGTATGTGTSTIYFQTATAQGSTNTTDNAPTTKMTILGNGNVGVGTAAPAVTLDVSGDIRYGRSFSLSGAASANFTGLNGDVDDSYEIILNGVIVASGSNRSIRVGPNGNLTTTNFTHLAQRFYYDGSTTVQDTNSRGMGGLTLGFSDWSVDGPILCRGTMTAKTGRIRILQSDCTFTPSVGGKYLKASNMSTWTDTTTSVTSLLIDFNGGTFTGSIILRTIRP